MACLSFDDRRGPFPKDVRPKPAIYHLLVWFQDVLAQAKTGVKKRLIILVPSVEILEQPHQSRTIKARDLCLNVRPSRLRFRPTSHHVAGRFYRWGPALVKSADGRCGPT